VSASRFRVDRRGLITSRYFQIALLFHIWASKISNWTRGTRNDYHYIGRGRWSPCTSCTKKLAFEVRDTEVRLQQIRLKCCCAVTGNKSPTVLTSTFQAKVGFPGNLHMVNRLSRKLPCVTFGQWEAPPTLVVLFMMPLCDVAKVVFTKQFSQIWLHSRYESRNKNRSLLYSCLPTYWNLS